MDPVAAEAMTVLVVACVGWCLLSTVLMPLQGIMEHYNDMDVRRVAALLFSFTFGQLLCFYWYITNRTELLPTGMETWLPYGVGVSGLIGLAIVAFSYERWFQLRTIHRG